MDELEAVGDPELRAALLFARRQSRPVTADELASAVDVHRNVARSRLERLVDAGLLQPGFERRTGRSGPGAGRPAKTYAVGPETEAIQFPDRRYEHLFARVVDALPAEGRTQTLERIGADFADELANEARLRRARSATAAVDAVCAAVRRLGFQATVTEVGRDEAIISTPTCPLRPLVRERPEVAAIDRGMWAGLVARALGRDVADVACETRDCLDDHASCRVCIRLRRL
jgi:predicted ArsR family transcriptional regulator